MSNKNEVEKDPSKENKREKNPRPWTKTEIFIPLLPCIACSAGAVYSLLVKNYENALICSVVAAVYLACFLEMKRDQNE